MDLDLHGSVLAMAMLTLGILIMTYFNIFTNIEKNLFRLGNFIDEIFLGSALIAALVLVGLRLCR